MASQWENAEADVEDVAGGLCLTILLPYLRDIKLKASDSNSVDLEAFRIISSEERKQGLDTEENSQYCAEFMIDGSNVSIASNDLSFEYSSESGLLHIYVESVHLDHEIDAATDANTTSTTTATNAAAAAAAAAVNPNPTTAFAPAVQTVEKKTVRSTIANGLKFLFSRNK